MKIMGRLYKQKFTRGLEMRSALFILISIEMNDFSAAYDSDCLAGDATNKAHL